MALSSEDTVLGLASLLLSRMRSATASPGLPSVTLTYAQSLDGCLAAARGVRTSLSGPATLRLTHALRAGHDAILVGVDTVLADDPRLSVRLVPGVSPRPVVLDTALRTPPSCALLSGGGVPPVIVCAAAPSQGDEGALLAWRERAAALEAAGATLLCLAPAPAVAGSAAHLRVSVRAALLALAAGVCLNTGGGGVHGGEALWAPRTIMIEGGARIIAAILEDGAEHPSAPLVRSVIVTVAPLFLLQPCGEGGRAAAEPVRVQASAPLGQEALVRLRIREPDARLVEGDVVMYGSGLEQN